jgi:hypothetical protein
VHNARTKLFLFVSLLFLLSPDRKTGIKVSLVWEKIKFKTTRLFHEVKILFIKINPDDSSVGHLCI